MVGLAKRKLPCLFLFDGYAEGVKEPALSTFTSALLAALSCADPLGITTAELRGGLPMLSEFAAQISEVSAEARSSSHTQTHDMALYRLLLWDLATALCEGSHRSGEMTILSVLAKRREECLAVSSMSASVRSDCSAILASCPGYISSYEIDAGNPVLRRAFYDGLMHLAYIDKGALIQQLSIEGDKDCILKGARDFRPSGLKWINHNYGDTPDRFRIKKALLSERGAISVDRLKRKTQTTVEGRVLRALIEASWTDRQGGAYRFSAAEPGQDVLQAVLPEGKFTKYLFNRNHKDGSAKAAFIIDGLGFIPDDWRFLAAQLYDGLLLSEPRDLEVRRWANGIGARFNTFVEVTSRQGKRGILRTGWMLEPKRLPQLVTAIPDHDSPNVVRPPQPPVLLPQQPCDAFFEELFRIANYHGQIAHAATLPTPMLINDFRVAEEGECGSARVIIVDGHEEFTFWLRKTGLGNSMPRNATAILCTVSSQSLERAEAYAKAFARVLALNGVPSYVQTMLA